VTAARDFGPLRYLGPAVVLLLCALLASGTGSARDAGGTYMNPVSKDFADTIADPSIIKAKDVYWYLHGTGESPRGREGSTRFNPMVPALQI